MEHFEASRHRPEAKEETWRIRGPLRVAGGVFGKWVERPILPETSRYDHVILAVVLSMARQEEVKRSRMLAEALGNIILIDTKWNTSK